MKYIVSIGGDRLEISLTADGVFVDGERIDASIVEVPGTPIVMLRIGDATHQLVIGRKPARGEFVVLTPSGRFDVQALDERTDNIRRLAGGQSSRSRHSSLVAPMPGLILRVRVEVGQIVQTGEGLVVMEAMKMENELRASADGTVRAIHVEPGAAVEKGAMLVELDPTG